MIDCLIVDDEKDSVDLLEFYAKKISKINLVLATTNPVDALTLINEGKIQLAFCDIQMPLISGLEMAKAALGKCKLIFVTAYANYALDGYEHEVVDYLLKPVSFSRFMTAFQKAEKMFVLDAPKLFSLNDKLKEFDLSKREIEIVEQMIKNMTAKEIGDTLHIAPSTVNTHVANIFKKVNVNKNIELISKIYNT